MFKRNKIEVVAARDYSNAEVMEYYGSRSVKELKSPSNIAPLMIGTSVITLNTLFNSLKSASATTGEWAIQAQPPQLVPTGYIADKTLETLATIFDPFIQIIVGISFPVASLVMAIGFFIMMFGMKEKALTMIMNAGIGYVLVQMLPLFNDILRTIGTAVQ
ncbi:hypothetical protein LG296_01800 [Ureibacillus chungkukjangi]|uniref:hypothetical protein n=1 Tax=Ureibacillus chungkukjangi TaxID=1202712 RepID=UPI00384FC02F